jgi:hypothetical protein
MLKSGKKASTPLTNVSEENQKLAFTWPPSRKRKYRLQALQWYAK